MTIMLETEVTIEKPEEFAATHHGFKGVDVTRRPWSSLEDVLKVLKSVAPISSEQMTLRFHHLKFKAGTIVCAAGDPCDAFYLIHAGFLKTSWIAPSGNEKILGFPMKGELVGLDGVFSACFSNTLTTLSESEVIVIPKELVTNERLKISSLRNCLLQEFSNALLASQKIEYMMGQLSAEARVAKFLLSLSQKFKNIGFSERSFHLRMTRQDIGSYLGLTLETVSRALSGFARRGYIKVDQKFVEILDVQALRALRRLSIGQNNDLD